MLSASTGAKIIRRAERLFEIVQFLRRMRQPVSAEKIAAELEVSKRTVYRDIAALIAQRVPILGEAGIGYILKSGFDMPPLMLTADELDAAILGANWVATRGEPELAKAAHNLIAKLEAVVPSTLRSHISEPSTSLAPVLQPKETIDSALLRKAIQDGLKIEIEYNDNSGTASRRVVWPILLGYRDKGRIIAAWCELRGDFRYFRTDRIAKSTILTQRIPERRNLLLSRWRHAMDEERKKYTTV